MVLHHSDATRGGAGTVGDNVNLPQTFSYAALYIRPVLGLLASNGKVDVLSSPSIRVRNNRKASIRVGDPQPIGTTAV